MSRNILNKIHLSNHFNRLAYNNADHAAGVTGLTMDQTTLGVREKVEYRDVPHLKKYLCSFVIPGSVLIVFFIVYSYTNSYDNWHKLLQFVLKESAMSST